MDDGVNPQRQCFVFLTDCLMEEKLTCSVEWGIFTHSALRSILTSNNCGCRRWQSARGNQLMCKVQMCCHFYPAGAALRSPCITNERKMSASCAWTTEQQMLACRRVETTQIMSILWLVSSVHQYQMMNLTLDLLC